MANGRLRRPRPVDDTVDIALRVHRGVNPLRLGVRTLLTATLIVRFVVAET